MNETDVQSRSRRAAGAALVGALLALGSPAAAAGHRTGVSVAGYSVRSVCSAPTPGRASCLALGLDPRASTRVTGARARRVTPATEFTEPWEGSLTPLEVKSAYSLPATPPTPQTIAIVDAYDDAKVVADLATYSKQLLGAAGAPPACTIAAGKVGDPAGGSLAEGCFLKVDQEGNVLPEGVRKAAEPPTSEGAEAQGWAGEIATDVELAHGLCGTCRIVLVEAFSSAEVDLEAAENRAVALGANEISNSWGGEEPPSDSAFNHPGVAITASAGDSGYLNWTDKAEAGYYRGVDYPASSPHVVAVGGTALHLSSGAWQSEKVWNEDPDELGGNSGAGGGGCSSVFEAPQWQAAVAGWSTAGCGSARGVADVAADGDPYTGVAVYDSTPEPVTQNSGWGMIGGTSVASPIVASTFALAGGAGEAQYPAKTLYSHVGAAGLHDVTAGGNGECKGSYSSGCGGSLASPLDCGPLYSICHAAAGYDGPTGVGTPDGVTAFQPGNEEGKSSEKEGPKGESEGEKSKSEGGGGTEGGGKGTAGGEVPAGGGGSTGTGGSPGAGGTAELQGEASSEEDASSPSAVPAGSIRLSNLALTFGALAALNHGRPRFSEVVFTFTVNAPAHVRVTLARRVRVHGRWRWAPQPGSFTLAVSPGGQRGRLRGRHALRPGRYRLTLAPTHGAGQSLAIVIG